MDVKVPFYNILNMFLTGLVFIGGCLIISPDIAVVLRDSDIIEYFGAGPEIVVTVWIFAVAYEVGLIINRAGSVILEPSLKWIGWIPFNDNYTLFNQKKKEYPIMSTLSREYALSRTETVLFLLLSTLSGAKGKYFLMGICAVITLLYFVSWRKHAGKIVALMKNE